MNAPSALPAEAPPAAPVLCVGQVPRAPVEALLARFGLRLNLVPDGAAIPGSYWGEPEAGIIASDVYARADTPVHSLLHEACHLIVLPPERRAKVHTDATDSVPEEDATCCLQIILADALPGVSPRAREPGLREPEPQSAGRPWPRSHARASSASCSNQARAEPRRKV